MDQKVVVEKLDYSLKPINLPDISIVYNKEPKNHVFLNSNNGSLQQSKTVNQLNYKTIVWPKTQPNNTCLNQEYLMVSPSCSQKYIPSPVQNTSTKDLAPKTSFIEPKVSLIAKKGRLNSLVYSKSDSVENFIAQDVLDKRLEVLNHLDDSEFNNCVSKVMNIVNITYGDSIQADLERYLGVENYKKIARGEVSIGSILKEDRWQPEVRMEDVQPQFFSSDISSDKAKDVIPQVSDNSTNTRKESNAKLPKKKQTRKEKFFTKDTEHTCSTSKSGDSPLVRLTGTMNRNQASFSKKSRQNIMQNFEQIHQRTNDVKSDKSSPDSSTNKGNVERWFESLKTKDERVEYLAHYLEESCKYFERRNASGIHAGTSQSSLKVNPSEITRKSTEGPHLNTASSAEIVETKSFVESFLNNYSNIHDTATQKDKTSLDKSKYNKSLIESDLTDHKSSAVLTAAKPLPQIESPTVSEEVKDLVKGESITSFPQINEDSKETPITRNYIQKSKLVLKKSQSECLKQNRNEVIKTSFASKLNERHNTLDFSENKNFNIVSKTTATSDRTPQITIDLTETPSRMIVAKPDTVLLVKNLNKNWLKQASAKLQKSQPAKEYMKTYERNSTKFKPNDVSITEVPKNESQVNKSERTKSDNDQNLPPSLNDTCDNSTNKFVKNCDGRQIVRCVDQEDYTREKNKSLEDYCVKSTTKNDEETTRQNIIEGSHLKSFDKLSKELQFSHEVVICDRQDEILCLDDEVDPLQVRTPINKDVAADVEVAYVCNIQQNESDVELRSKELNDSEQNVAREEFDLGKLDENIKNLLKIGSKKVNNGKQTEVELRPKNELKNLVNEIKQNVAEDVELSKKEFNIDEWDEYVDNTNLAKHGSDEVRIGKPAEVESRPKEEFAVNKIQQGVAPSTKECSSSKLDENLDIKHLGKIDGTKKDGTTPTLSKPAQMNRQSFDTISWRYSKERHQSLRRTLRVAIYDSSREIQQRMRLAYQKLRVVVREIDHDRLNPKLDTRVLQSKLAKLETLASVIEPFFNNMKYWKTTPQSRYLLKDMENRTGRKKYKNCHNFSKKTDEENENLCFCKKPCEIETSKPKVEPLVLESSTDQNLKLAVNESEDKKTDGTPRSSKRKRSELTPDPERIKTLRQRSTEKNAMIFLMVSCFKGLLDIFILSSVEFNSNQRVFISCSGGNQSIFRCESVFPKEPI